jgi:hypothetical protein
MATEPLIRAKIHRLEELRKYQAYYGPNTPYPVIVEINDLELELRRLLAAEPSRAKATAKKGAKKKKKAPAPLWQFWRMSQATFDAIVAIAFIAFLFLLGTILFVAYTNTRPDRSGVAVYSSGGQPSPTLRPTFTPTGQVAVVVAEAAGAEIAAINDPNLPPAEREATPVPTPVPSLTPTAPPPPTASPTPTETPRPTQTPAPRPTAIPVPPTATSPPPPPSFPFVVTEQGNRTLQRTSYHVITVYIAIVSEGNIPLGGYKVIADNGAGGRIESGLSDWNWSATNCLDCGYIKQGNLKLDLGPAVDGVWSLTLADPNGQILSNPVSFTYSSDPEQWVWDFVIFKRQSG